MRIEFTGDLRVGLNSARSRSLLSRPLAHFGAGYVVGEVLPLNAVARWGEPGAVLQHRVCIDQALDRVIRGSRPVDSSGLPRVGLNAVPHPLKEGVAASR